MNNVDQILLAAIRESDNQNDLVQRCREFCTEWMASSNGKELDARKLTDLLYDVSKLPDEKRMLCEKDLLASGVFKGAKTLQRRLKTLNPPLTSSAALPTVMCAEFDGLIDIVEHNGTSAFLIRNIEGKPEIQVKVERNGKCLIPPSLEQIPWKLPRALDTLSYLDPQFESAEQDRRLFEDLLAYHRAISELPSERHYLLLAAFVAHTYLMEKFEYSPMLCFYAVPERGKSRTGKGILYVSYRGLHVESLRDAYIVRVASDYGATLFFDVRDIWGKAEKTGTDDILLNRFERGTMVPRVLDPSKGPHEGIRYFRIFGPTIIATNEDINFILETRVIPITMPDTSRQFEDNVKPEMAQSLKERLVAFRFRHYEDELPQMDKPAKGRLGDILRPLLQIIRLAAPSYSCDFMDLVQDLEAGRKVEKAETLDAGLIRTIVELKDRITFGYLAVKDITEAINKDRPERYRFSSQKIGRKLKALGFEHGSSASGGSAIAYDEPKIRKLAESYGLEQISEMPVMPESLVNSATDISEVTDISRSI